MSLTVMLVLTGLAEGFLHYFPWRQVMGRELPRPAAYVLGVLGFAVPYGVWLVQGGLVAEAVALAEVLAVAGGVVLALYALDWVVRVAWERREALRRESELAQVAKEALGEQATGL